MSLAVDVLTLKGLNQGRLAYVKVTFRDKLFKTSKVKRGEIVYFGEKFVWPIARKLEKTDVLLIQCLTVDFFTLHKVVGTINIAIASLMTQQRVICIEPFVNEQSRITNVLLESCIEYVSPILGYENYSRDAFDVPVYNLKTIERDEDKIRLPSDCSSDDSQEEYENEMLEENADFIQNDNISELSLLPERDYQLPKHIDPLALRMVDFEISVTIYEARGLTGQNINPVFEIQCGKQKKSTELKMQTNTPFYNEYFTFDFFMSRLELMEQIIKITAVNKRSHIITRHIFSGKVIGQFSIDAKTVYSNENHSFFRKWAVLIDPKAPTLGEKGWVKVDISVLCSGDKPKRPNADDNEENPNIEANLLIPQCISNIPRRICEMSVYVYQAEDLPCMNTGIMADIKHAILGESKPLADPYVEISFGGFTGRTKTISLSYCPDWNQQIVFTESFPPYVSRVRLAVRDKDMVKDETISTIFIDLHKIMYAGCSEVEGFLPTYGPSWVNLYGTPRLYSYSELIKGDRGQNQNLAEGVAFRGRLLLAIKTTPQPDSSKIGVAVRPCNPVSNTVAGRRETYLLFASIYETTLITEEIGKQGKPISFEMSIGITGNVLDLPLKTRNDKEITDNEYINSLTEPKNTYTFDNKYFHIPYKNKKPCLFMLSLYEDHRQRMYIPNILERFKQKMCEYMRQTNYLLSVNKKVQARRYLQKTLNEFLASIDEVLVAVNACRGTAKKTMLDVKYQRLICINLEKMKEKIRTIYQGLSRKNIMKRLKECRKLVKLLDDKIVNPQHGLPDVFIYMVRENVRVAYTRIKARSIISSVIDSERGSMCGKMNTIYLKKMDNSILPAKTNYNIQAQMQLYLWLGLLKDMKSCKAGLPEGYKKDTFSSKMPPRFIEYTEESMFQLRVYLFMGRNLIGSDDSGFSDPFAKFLIGEHIAKSSMIEQTRSPIWDETIIINNIMFNYAPEVLKSSPPNVVVELFDWDSDTSEEFIGRVFCQPKVFIKGDDYIPAKLEWWNIFRGTLPAGDILAAFDLFEMNMYSKNTYIQDIPSQEDLENMTTEINSDSLGEKNENKLRIPYNVRPALVMYRIEILMWGVRQLQRIEILPPNRHGVIPIKRIGIFPVNQPRIIIDIAGYVIESNTIKNWSLHPNFEDNLVSLDLRLPMNPQFWPPISILCTNNTIFGLKQIVGNHVISDIFTFYEEDDVEDAEIDKTIISVLNDSSSSVSKGAINVGYDYDDQTIKMGGITLVELKGQGPGIPKEIVSGVSNEELEAADWWTRYYATIGDLSDETKVKINIEKLSESESEDELTGDILKDIPIELKSDEEDDVVEIPEDVSKKKKKKTKKKKKKKKKRKPVLNKNAKEQFLKEIPEKLIMETLCASDNSWIERITIYPCELENVKDFGGFHLPFRSFPLYRGKEIENEDMESPDRFGGVFKGNICIYKIENDLDDESEDEIKTHDINEVELMKRKEKDNEYEVISNLRLSRYLLDNASCRFLVRIYIIRGINLHPADLNGKSDPYVLLRLGDQEINDRSNYIPKTLNPIFGRYFELEVTFPQESFLLVQIYDWDRLTNDDLIGETKIDLENRWLSPHRGTCGLMPVYHNHGFLKWKDGQLPTQILKSLCEQHNVPLPIYDTISDSVEIGDICFYADTMIGDDDGLQIKSVETLALQVLNNWDKVVPGCKLVPEHIETRPLYTEDKPGIEQGLLEMWVDMYPAGSSVPAPIDISPRIPVSYELRIIILQTEKVRLTDVNFFTKEKSVDIYLKAWMKSTDIDLLKTDVHYRSLSGQGLFNWRFIFKFDYLKAEDNIVYKNKQIYEIDENEYKTPCYLNMQVLDSDLIMSDTILGKLKFRLSKFPKPAKYYKSCDPFQHTEACAKFNLFKNKKVRGWWPLIFNPKDEDPDDEDGAEIGGIVEMELELLLAEEAESNPAGLERAEPLPLEKPDRPDGSFLSFLNPWNTIKYFIKYRLKWILIKLLVIFIFTLLIVLFIYNFPGNLSRVVVDKMSG